MTPRRLPPPRFFVENTLHGGSLQKDHISQFITQVCHDHYFGSRTGNLWILL